MSASHKAFGRGGWNTRLTRSAGHRSLTPGRYVGVSPEDEGESLDFAQTMREIHTELDTLNARAATLATTIRKNFEALGI